jgi:hypothetical protein
MKDISYGEFNKRLGRIGNATMSMHISNEEKNKLKRRYNNLEKVWRFRFDKTFRENILNPKIPKTDIKQLDLF